MQRSQKHALLVALITVLAFAGLARGQAHLIVSPTSITVATSSMKIASRQLLTVASSDGSPISFLAYGSAGWLIVASNQSGGTLMTTPASFYVAFPWLGVGTWSANVIITTTLSGVPAPQATIAVPVALTVAQAGGPPDIYSVSNAASWALATSISPGEIVSILGTNLGPASPLGTQIDSTGKVSTSLGGVSVYFSSEWGVTGQQYAAPLLYVSATQINCVVPYEVAQWAGAPWPGIAWIQVSYLGVSSLLVYPVTYSMQLGTTAPGIFTAAATGTGQAAALNSDNSPNTTSNPASAGSIVQVWMTGEGQSSPPGITGSVTCSAGCATTSQIPKPLLPVTATVGGQPAAVSFYGEAPGMVSGVMQVNVTVPPYTRSGATSLSITVGSSTQAGITIAVR